MNGLASSTGSFFSKLFSCGEKKHGSKAKKSATRNRDNDIGEDAISDDFKESSRKTLDTTAKTVITDSLHSVSRQSSLDADQDDQVLRRTSSRSIGPYDDFIFHMKALGKDELDEEGFHMLLDDIGYTRERNGLFDDLLAEIRESKGHKFSSPTRVTINEDDIRALYESTPYKFPASREYGSELMLFANSVFDRFDADKSGDLSVSELQQLVKSFLHRKENKKALSELYQMLDKNNDGRITREEFKEVLLKLSTPTLDREIPLIFNDTIIDPALTSSKEFVKHLEHFTTNHSAVNHHLLQNLSNAVFGRQETAEYILRFFSCYTKMNRGFKDRVNILIRSLDNPHHIHILQENLDEEMGIYDEETFLEVEKRFNVERNVIEGIDHGKLFQRFVKHLEKHKNASYTDMVPDYIVRPFIDAMDKASKDPIELAAALYFGSELIVPQLYSALHEGVLKSFDMTNEERIFLLLHIDMDEDHVENMRQIIEDLSATTENRVKLVQSAERVLNSRVQFYDRLVSNMDFNAGIDDITSLEAFEKNVSHSKSRQTVSNHPSIFTMCEEFAHKAISLNIDCGDGFAARKLTEMGSTKVIGTDSNEILLQKANRERLPGQHFLKCAATDLRPCLSKHYADIDVVYGINFQAGIFDLVVSLFPFELMSTKEMQTTLQNVYSLLKPGAHFVFSVTHPISYSRGSKDGYFTLEDQRIEYEGGTVNHYKFGSKTFSTQFKTLGAYIKSLKDSGFDIIDMVETRNLEHVAMELVFKVRKPSNSEARDTTKATFFDTIPPKLTWSPTVRRNFTAFTTMVIPIEANNEVIAATLKCYDIGVKVDDIVIGEHVDPNLCKSLKDFCLSVRKRLIYETGAVLVKGLDMDALGGIQKLEMMTHCSRIASFIVSSFIGIVDGSARGKIFDVKNAKLNAMEADNVLFSVSDSECSWHTDGASKDRFYDAVALMCISPASEGGAFHITNACNAYDAVEMRLPKFLMYELTRPLPRDVLENGKGKGTLGLDDELSRSKEVLAMRIRYNSYPIYTINRNRMRFRYMRHWIETGHQKTFWKIPTLLKIAMDILDDELDNYRSFSKALERGDIIYGNNAVLAHSRDSFKDNDPNLPPRHLLRVWIQFPKEDLI